MTKLTQAQTEAAAKAIKTVRRCGRFSSSWELAEAALAAAAEVVSLEKRPFAFRVYRDGEWILFADEKLAQEFADSLGVNYDGLYVRAAAAEVGELDWGFKRIAGRTATRIIEDTIERCAQVADNLATDWGVAVASDIAKEIAAAIRALKDK